MPLFRRRRGDPGEPPPIPGWAAFLDREEYRTFLGRVDLTLERFGFEQREWSDGAVRVVVDGETTTLGLANLAQILHGAPREEWQELVDTHFRNLLATNARDQEAIAFEDAEPILKLRLWSIGDLPKELELVARPFADDLKIVLSLDWPESVANVTPDQVASWGRAEDELFALAERNTKAEADGLEREVIDHNDGATTHFRFGDSFFAASQALWPETILGELPPAGALVAFPHRHMAWAHALTDLRVVGVISDASQIIHNMYVEGPGSISPHLYWFRPGDTAVRLPIEVSEEQTTFTPPPEFLELLERLPEEPGR